MNQVIYDGPPVADLPKVEISKDEVLNDDENDELAILAGVGGDLVLPGIGNGGQGGALRNSGEQLEYTMTSFLKRENDQTASNLVPAQTGEYLDQNSSYAGGSRSQMSNSQYRGRA